MINSYKFTFEQGVSFQNAVMNTQMNLEDAFLDMAITEGKNSVILCDRGLMDGSAYVSK